VGRRLPVLALTYFALIVALATLAAAFAGTVLLGLLPTVRLQLVSFALLAVLLPLTAVLLSGLVMFHMGADVKILATAAAAASAAVATALTLGTSIGKKIERLRAVSADLAAGDLTIRASESGPRELAELGRSFNQMAANIERLFDARAELVTAASHDLRTPIASINAMLEAIGDGLAEPEEYLGLLREQTQRLASLVEDLFDVARIDAGTLSYELRSVSLAPIVTSCLRGLTAQARARNVRLEQHHEAGAATVLCAPTQVERVLLNLLTNALHHTPSDGTIAVILKNEQDAVLVTVEDTGDGLTAEARRSMFDRFWRGDPSRSGYTGRNGLGLTIARGLVEAQGGRMWAAPSPTGGASVSFTLPAAV
jgi:signal transduction histidine kinase